jgi:Flp pilus assembly protein TadD
MTSRLLLVDAFELEVLEHLTYIIEAFAEEAFGDARWEIAALHRRLAAAPEDADPEYRSLVAAALAQALDVDRERRDWPRGAAVTLSSLSRKLWARILPR